jgi:histidinol-phosphate aminotransferase
MAPETNSFSRRNFLGLSLTASAAAACGSIFTEHLLARPVEHAYPAGAVIIDANENPLGPCAAARDGVIAQAPNGGRYSFWLADEFVEAMAAVEGLPVDHIFAFGGSSVPLHYSVLSYTSPTRSYVTADPGYEAGMQAAQVSGARVVKVALTKTYAHDVKAMLAAAPEAGLFYVCSPNNPTGTLTPHADIEYLVESKPKEAMVLVDEAYIHFSDATTATDLVKAGKDVIVLRTFSKIYGMAGLRCGVAIARPDILKKINAYTGWNSLPITALAAATASLHDKNVVPERKRLNATNRERVFDWLRSNNYSFIPSQSNCFLLDTGRDGRTVIDAMRTQNVFIGRIWPVMPKHVRITVGTAQEMEQFQAAYQRVMKGAIATGAGLKQPERFRNLDGVRVPV